MKGNLKVSDNFKTEDDIKVAMVQLNSKPQPSGINSYQDTRTNQLQTE